MNKLLISFDINEKDENKREQAYDAIKFSKQAERQWVHLHESVWVIIDGDAKTTQTTLSNFLPNSYVCVTDVSKREVYTNDIIEAGHKGNDKKILTTNY